MPLVNNAASKVQASYDITAKDINSKESSSLPVKKVTNVTIAKSLDVTMHANEEVKFEPTFDNSKLNINSTVSKIIANQSPSDRATGELMVLKNVIKRHCDRAIKGKYVKLANANLGRVCVLANTTNINNIIDFIHTLKELIIERNYTDFIDKVTKETSQLLLQ